MTSRHPFGWSLPPGVTQRMIDEAAGGYEDPPEPCSVCGDPLCRDPHEDEGFAPSMEHHLWHAYQSANGTVEIVIQDPHADSDDLEVVAELPVTEDNYKQRALTLKAAEALCAAHNATDPYGHLPLTGEGARALLALITWAQHQGYWPLSTYCHEHHRSYYDLFDRLRSNLYRISAEQPERSP